MARCFLKSLVQVTSRINYLGQVASTPKLYSSLTSQPIQAIRNSQFPLIALYKLRNHAEQNVTKVDPILNKDLVYIDPILVHQSFERLDPFAKVDAECPTFNSNKVISEGNVKETPLHLVNMLVIRKRKMRKHKLKKLRKKMKFVWRRVRQAREKAREKEIVDYEKEMAKWAKEYDPEKDIEAELEKARDAGWFIDVVEGKVKVNAEELNPGTKL